MKNRTYHIITIGCQMNKSDSERIAGYLEELGFKPAKDDKKAGIVVLTTCGVRQSAEDRVYGLANNIKKNNPKSKLILTGCLSLRKDVRKRLAGKVDVWLPITELPLLGSNLGLKIKSKAEKNYLKIRPKYNSKISAFVPIGNGCNNFCSYCVVPYARGREIYRPAEEIVAEVKNLVDNGYKEIILIAQNVNSYISDVQISKSEIQKSNKINFAKLLKLVNDIHGNFWIRFATSHPKDMSNELIKTISKCDKVCKHIHLPAQAGDDKVLKEMNRKYTHKDYLDLITRIKKVLNSSIRNNSKQVTSLKGQNCNFALPVSLSTDIIVGFPGEIRKQFSETAKLFREVKFDMAYIARYSPRPGTAAAILKDDISREEKKRREEELMKILRKTALDNNKEYIGKSVEILIEGKSKSGEFYGHTSTGKNVKFRGANLKVGEFVCVEILKVKDFGLEGEVRVSQNV